MAEKVDAITGGQLTIEYFPNGELGADADILRQMKANEIQLVVCQTAPVVSFVPEVAVFDLPMVFAKYDGATIDKVLNGDSAFKADLGTAFNNNGFQLLGTLQNATYRLTTANKELKTLADFNSLQIRTMENPNHMAFWTAIGAQPTPMAWNEVYFALQSGNIAAQENAADTCVGNNLNEVQDYLAFTNHILYANMMIMNQEAYDSLDPLYQEALGQAVAEAMAEIGAQLATIDADNKAELESRGMTLIEYAPEFYDEVLAVPGVVDLYKSINEQIGGLGDTLQEALANAGTLSTAAAATIRDTEVLLGDTESLARSTGKNLDAGTRQSLAGLSAALRQTARALAAADEVRAAKTTITDIIEDTWRDYTGEVNNLLLMDVTAEPVSLTDSRNPSPDSIQVLLRTQEIKEAPAEKAGEDAGTKESTTFWERVGQMFRDFWNAIAGVFH